MESTLERFVYLYNAWKYDIWSWNANVSFNVFVNQCQDASLHFTLHVQYSYLLLHAMAEPPIQSIYLNAGKFAAVSSIASSNLAFKTVHSDSHLHREDLIKEFYMYVSVSFTQP
jgi:hypothetical protein